MWRETSIVIKVLAPATPQEVFIDETATWGILSHSNVLTLFGTSSTYGESPLFFVTPYMKHGSVVNYLKSLGPHSPVNLLNMIYEVGMGMEYLHSVGLFHGDLRVRRYG